MYDFREAAKRQQAYFRHTSSTISDKGRTPSEDDDVARRHGHVLAAGCEDENLYPPLRGEAGARRFFKERKIKWWRDARSGDAAGEDGPTRNMAGSQVACVNFMLPLARIPGALAAAIGAIDDDVKGIIDIHHEGRTSPVEFEWIGLGKSLEGGTTRGANNTSVDAFVIADIGAGRRAYLMEWKHFEENTSSDDKGAGIGGQQRKDIYSDLYSAESSAFSGEVPMSELLYEPFYQLMRLRLLADRMVANRELDVTDAKVVVVVPEGNSGYRERITSPRLAERFPQHKTVSDVMRATLKDPDATFASVCPSVLVAAVERKCGSKDTARAWVAYQRERYLTDRRPLTFTFRNLGPVKSAELELGDLTIVAGRNNTGKTYLVYTLYGFLKAWKTFPPPRPAASAASRSAARYPVFEEISNQAAETGHAELPVAPDVLSRERRAVMRALTRHFSENIPSTVFNVSPEKFENASIDMHLGTEPLWSTVSAEPEDTPSIRYDGTTLSAVGAPPAGKRIHPVVLRRRLWGQYLRFLFPDLPSNPFVLSAERFGISLFYRELDFVKSQIVDLLQKYGDRKRKDDSDFPFELLDETAGRYALPIKENIDYTRSIPDLRQQRSEIYQDAFFKDIRKLMNGYYTASGDAIEFRSAARGDRRFAIPLHLASSSARGLSDLYFFLRHAAQKNHLLIIDEPESHLDTANQILLARLLARLVQAGLKVLVTTHSDYIVKEINNLIMLNGTFAHKAQVIRKLNYRNRDFMDPKRIRAYVARDQGLHKCSIDEFGIEMPNFDETIDGINRVANELFLRLEAESRD